MKASPECPTLPIAIGNEQETMLMVGPMGANYAEFHEAIDFVNEFRRYLPNQLKWVPEHNSSRVFTQNGGLVYNGGPLKSGNLEIVTPECSTPEQLAGFIQSNENVQVAMLSNYVEATAKAEKPERARVQRRVVDAQGNSRATHDNFEVKDSAWLNKLGWGEESDVLLHYLATRSFITGAGYVKSDGLRFAQKAQTVSALSGYGFLSTGFRPCVDDDTGNRLEIRCSDANISPWAIQARVGGAAILLTMLQTPMLESLVNDSSNVVTSGATRLKHFSKYNNAILSGDGNLQRTANTLHALDYQERLWDIADSELGKYVDLPEEYQTLIHELQYYCQDFRKVLYGELELADLADRSDVAAKFEKIVHRMRKDIDEGKTRKPTDIIARADDMAYDHIDISPNSAGKARVTYGAGFRLRAKGKFRLPVKNADVEQAFYRPPVSTRAYLRGTAIRLGKASSVTWSNAYKAQSSLVRSLGPVMRDETNKNLDSIGL